MQLFPVKLRQRVEETWYVMEDLFSEEAAVLFGCNGMTLGNYYHRIARIVNSRSLSKGTFTRLRKHPF